MAPFARGVVAVLCCRVAVLGGLRALLGGLRAPLRGALSSCGAADDPIAAGERARLLVLLGAGFALRQREIAYVGGVVSRPRRMITSVRDLVTLRGGVQTRPGGLVAPVGGLVALAGCTLADVLAGVVLFRVTAGRQVLIAGGLIAIGSQLVAVGARLIAVRARLSTSDSV